jgi:hypothetical protein
MDDYGRIECHRFDSVTKHDAFTAAKQPAKIGIDQNSADHRTAGFV